MVTYRSPANDNKSFFNNLMDKNKLMSWKIFFKKKKKKPFDERITSFFFIYFVRLMIN